MVRQSKTSLTTRVLAAIAMASTAVVAGAVGPAAAAPPSNDDFANAAFTFEGATAVTSTTVDATTEVGEPIQSCGVQGDGLQNSIWWRVEPGAGAHLFTTAGSAIDTQMSIYTGTSFNDLVEVGCDDDNIDAGGIFAARVLNTQNQVQYYVQVDGFAGQQGDVTFDVIELSCPSVWQVDTLGSGDFRELTDGLAAAAACAPLNGGTIELQVAAGVYFPTEDGGSRASSFVMERAVRMTGGHPTGFASAPDPDLNETFLSGALTNAYNVVEVRGSRAEIDGFIVENGNANGNTVGERSGAGIKSTSGVLEISNTTIRTNSAVEAGSAISHEGSNFELIQSTIEGNSGDGAAVLIDTAANVLVSESTFQSNTGNFGSSIELIGSNFASINNTIIESTSAAPILVTDARLRMMNTIIEAGFSSNMRLFADADVSIFNSVLTEGAGVSVEDASAELLIRNSILSNVSEPVTAGSITTSIDFQDSIVEGSGGSASWDNTLGNDLGGNLDVDPQWVDPSNGNFRLLNGSPALDVGDDSGLPLDFDDLDNDGVTNTEPVPDLDRTDRVKNGTIDLGPYELAPVSCQPIIFVNDSAPPNGDGLTWATAFDDLQIGITQAEACAGVASQIWIAGGVYTPDVSDRTVRFSLPDGVALIGGFDGTEANLSDRPSPLTDVTLSGDLNADDGATPGPDNSQGVVHVERENVGQLFDLTVSGGNADGANGGNSEGGGIDVEPAFGAFDAGELELSNVTIRNNRAATFGGGVHSGGRVFIVDSSFLFNSAEDGGGLAALGGTTEILDTNFSFNTADRFGGAIRETNASLMDIVRVSFTSNQAGQDGGAIYGASDLNVVGSTFRLNSAVVNGGAIFANVDSLFVSATEFAGNRAGRLGGAMLTSAPGTITSSTFEGNSAPIAGGAILNDSQPTTNLAIDNSIFWDNASNAGAGVLNEGVLSVRRSIVQGSGGSGAGWDTTVGTDLGGNLDADPLFTNTPGFDFTPLPGSPAIGAGDAAVMAPDAFDLDQDGDVDERTPDNLRSDRIQGTGPEIGAIEVQDGLPGDFQTLATPCVIYDSTLASGSLAGPLAGGEIRTIDAAGTLPASQGGSSSNCIPSTATSATFLIAADNPLRGGNFRLSAAGIVPNGGVVNFADNGLDNANTVTVPLSGSGQVDVGANGGATGAGLDLAGVRLVALAYTDPAPGSRFVPLTPCAVADSRTNRGPAGSFVGPFGDGAPYPAVDVTGTFSSDQGGGNTDCGVPADAEALVVNVVAINPAGGTGRILVGANGSTPTEGTPFAPLGMNNAAVAVVPLVGDDSLTIDIEAAVGASTHVRLVVLGYMSSNAGSVFVPVNPCAIFDTRNGEEDFDGLRQGGETTTYDITGVVNTDQGGSTESGSCGVPANATGVLLNLVAINPVGEGNLQVFAAGASPTGGVLNFAALSPSMNNANTVPVELSDDGQVSVFVNGGPGGNGVDRTEIRGVVLGYYFEADVLL